MESTVLSFEKVEPMTVGMQEEKLREMDKIIPVLYKNLNGIILIRSNKMVFERYYNGCQKEDAFHIASVTKSILSALIGIAVDQGYIKSLDQKVLDFFPDYICPPSEIQKKAVTIRHLLTMRAPYLFKPMQEPIEKMVRRKDWVKFSLDLLGKNGNIGSFKYANCGAHLLSAILTKTTGKSAREFANTYLFKPLGIETVADNPNQTFDYEGLFGKQLQGWARDPMGYSTGGWGLKLTTRDLAKLGSLYINDGKYNQQQIVPKEWVKESITGIPLEKEIKVSFTHYGYLWCIYQTEKLFAYMALGDGGNMICCIPEKEIVVAVTSKNMRKAHDRWDLIVDYILPSLL